MQKHTFIAALVGAAACSAAAHAQEAVAPDSSVFDGNYITIGAGAAYTPSYEGSDKQVFTPIPLVQGRIQGIGISPRPTGVALDFIPDAKDARIGFALGPVAGYSSNRAHRIKDSVVSAAGKLKSAIDVGVAAGVTGYRLLDAYDSLTASVDVKWNVNSASKGMTVTPTLTYATPLSKAILVTVSGYGKHVDSDYAHYYYDVSALQRGRSGLPLYTASKGWAAVGGGILAAYDLSGDLRNGGFALVAAASYEKLLNDARRTPYTSIRGDDNQWTFAGGVAYTF